MTLDAPETKVDPGDPGWCFWFLVHDIGLNAISIDAREIRQRGQGLLKPQKPRILAGVFGGCPGLGQASVQKNVGVSIKLKWGYVSVRTQLCHWVTWAETFVPKPRHHWSYRAPLSAPNASFCNHCSPLHLHFHIPDAWLQPSKVPRPALSWSGL